MRIRLYGGAGHERMVYLPASVALAPPQIALPRIPMNELEILLVLDPALGVASVGISYRDTGIDDPDGYRRYTYIEDTNSDHENLATDVP